MQSNRRTPAEPQAPQPASTRSVAALPDSALTSDGQRRDGSPTAGRRRNWTFAGWLIIAAVFAIVFELTCRVQGWVLYRMPILSPYRFVEDLLVRDADGVHGRANAQFEKYVMNELGTRGPPAQIVPTPGVVRIITVGASETFGQRESPDHEFPRQLEDSLNARLTSIKCPGAPVRFEVLNAAFAGMTVPTIEQDVRKRLIRYRPSIVAAYLTLSPYLLDVVPFAATPDTSRRPAGEPKPGSAFHFRAAEHLRDQLKGLLPERLKAWLRHAQTEAVVSEHNPSWRFTTPPPERLAAFDADLRRLVGTIRAIGATPVLITHGNALMGRVTVDTIRLVEWEKMYPRATSATLIAFDSLARLDVLKIAADSNAVSVDAARSLASSPPQSFSDPIHLTDLGAAIVARDVARGIFSASEAVRACVNTSGF